MSSKPLVGISSCLLGENVRYDGVLKLDPYLRNEMSRAVSFLGICPETGSGMTVPREPMDLFETGGSLRMITLGSQKDMTGLVSRWIEEKLSELSGLNLSGFILKARSPSCAVDSAKVHTTDGMNSYGRGLFAEALIQRFPQLPVAEEEQLHHTAQRDEFLKRVFTVHRLHRR